MAKAKKTYDVGQWVFLSVACVCATYAVLNLNLERVEGWIALAPAVIPLIGQVYSMTRGKAVEKEEP